MTFDEYIENIVADSGDARYYVSLLIQEVLDKVSAEIDRSEEYLSYTNYEGYVVDSIKLSTFIEDLKQEYSDNS